MFNLDNKKAQDFGEQGFQLSTFRNINDEQYGTTETTSQILRRK